MGNFMSTPESVWTPDWLPPKPMSQSVTTALSLYAKEFRTMAPDLFSAQELPRTVIALMDHRHIEPAITVNVTDKQLELNSFFGITLRNKGTGKKRRFVDYVPTPITRELVHGMDELDLAPLAQHLVHDFVERCDPLSFVVPYAVSLDEEGDSICHDDIWLKGFARTLQNQMETLYLQIVSKTLPAL